MIFRYTLILFLIFLIGCTSFVKKDYKYLSQIPFKNVSYGLPERGQWRENILLFDVNNDGFFDIIVPPPRLASKEERIPHIFLWDKITEKWENVRFNFHKESNYEYGGIDIGDIDKDGNFDIIFAVHNNDIVILKNNDKNEFIEEVLDLKEKFYSRTVKLLDLNRDKFLDFVAFSEANFTGKYKPKGLLLGINKEGKDWELRLIEESIDLFGDSMAIGDVNGDGNEDIVIAPLVYGRENYLVWFGDGDGGFIGIKIPDIAYNIAPYYVKVGDIDGDGVDEIVFKLIGTGENYKPFVKVYKWRNDGFLDISKGLQSINDVIVFELIDLNEDGKEELIALCVNGFNIYNYSENCWFKIGEYSLPEEETRGAFDIKAKKNIDGSIFIVYNLGKPEEKLKGGLRAYSLKLK